jgi:branched-chain amino acid transport system substrate-binding protein
MVSGTNVRGVSGTFRFVAGENVVMPYPDAVNDVSLGMAHQTYQIQDLKQVLISPDPYTSGQFQLPPWMA